MLLLFLHLCFRYQAGILLEETKMRFKQSVDNIQYPGFNLMVTYKCLHLRIKGLFTILTTCTPPFFVFLLRRNKLSWSWTMLWFYSKILLLFDAKVLKKFWTLYGEILRCISKIQVINVKSKIFIAKTS